MLSMWKAHAKRTVPRRTTLAATAVSAASILALVAGCAGSATPGDNRAASAAATDSVGATDPGASPQPTMSDGSAASWDVSKLPDPCRTLTKDEVAEILAVTVDKADHLDSWPPVCAFSLPGPPAEWFYISDDSGEMAKADFEKGRANPPASEPVTGVGDQAYWVPDKLELQVLSGGTHLVARFGAGTPPADARTKAVALASKALPRAKPA